MAMLRKLGGQAALILVFAASTALTGCVERRYTIRTNPPGALVVVNGEEIGPTPVSRSFTYYGDREITTMLEGFETETRIQPIKAPWWDNQLSEFFVENLIPYTFRDERDYTFNLTPATVTDVESLRNRAQDLRTQALAPPPARRGGILGFFGF